MTLMDNITALLGIVTPIAVLASVIYSIRLAKKVDGQLKGVTSKVFGILGNKGVDVQKIKKIEKLVADDVQQGLLDLFPEFELILGWLSPDTLDKIKENPAILPVLWQRYSPILKQLGIKGLGGAKEKVEAYEL